MPDYQKMYHVLFNKITDVIGELQSIQRQTEEIYISGEEQIIELSIVENEKEDSVSAINAQSKRPQTRITLGFVVLIFV